MFKLTSRYAGCFTAKCWIFCDIISIVYKSVPWKTVVELLYTII